MKFNVLREHLGDKFYKEGDIRDADPMNVASLVRNGILRASDDLQGDVGGVIHSDAGTSSINFAEDGRMSIVADTFTISEKVRTDTASHDSTQVGVDIAAANVGTIDAGQVNTDIATIDAVADVSAQANSDPDAVKDIVLVEEKVDTAPASNKAEGRSPKNKGE